MTIPTHLPTLRPSRLAGLGALLLFAAGCGGSAVSPSLDVDRALVVLRQALDAWKGGQPHDALASQSPPIRVADEDWLLGSRLTSYEMSSRGQVIGNALRCPVKLSIQDKSGKDLKKNVFYNVTTAPSESVIRQD